MVAGEVLLNFYPSFFRFDNQKSRFYSPLRSTVQHHLTNIRCPNRNGRQIS
jgi:hypothetical protein